MIKIKKYFFWKKEIEIEYYDRVMIYLNYNDADFLKKKKVIIIIYFKDIFANLKAESRDSNGFNSYPIYKK